MISLPKKSGTLIVCWHDISQQTSQAFVITSKPGENSKNERQEYIQGCKEYLQNSYPTTWETLPLVILPIDIQNNGLEFFETIGEIIHEIDEGTYKNESSVSILAGELFL